MRADSLLNEISAPEFISVFRIAGGMVMLLVPLLCIAAAFKMLRVDKYGNVKQTRSRKPRKPAAPQPVKPVARFAPAPAVGNRDADLIRGTALRLLAAGRGHEVVPVATDATVRRTLPFVLDSILPAADRAHCIVALEPVDAGVKVTVHPELAQPAGIVHVSPTDPDAWEQGRS